MASSVSYFTREKDNSFSKVLSELKALGVKVPKIKKLKSTISKQETAIPEKDCKIFGVGLSEQEWTSEEYPIPKFIAWATAYLQKFINQEIGLFRKAGNRARQRNLRAKLEKGESIQDPDPNDVASLLKQWLRELPESLIPCYLQDVFIQCKCLEVEKDRVSACLFAVLLLPPDHMYTLKHLLRFLSSISENSGQNKMGIENLAIIMAPNIFMTNKSAEKMNNLLSDHTAIIQLLIKNSDKIGEAPPSIFQRPLLGTELHVSVDTLDVGSSKYKRKRSGPVQDILYGFKKLVGHNGSSFTWRNSSEDHFMETPKVPRQALSLVNLDSPNFATPKETEDPIREKTGAHARRKSFGALLLRKKYRKRPENETPSVAELVAKELGNDHSSENSKNIAALSNSSCNFSNLKLNSSFHNKEKHDSNLRNSKEIQSGNLRNTADTAAKNVTANKPIVKYSQSCKLQVCNESEVFKTPLPPNPRNFILKAENYKEISPRKFGLSRQEAFSIKPVKQKSFSNINKTTDKENVQIKREPAKNLIYTCSHSQNSACNTKCDKNKSGNCERIPEKKTKELCTNSRSKTQKSNTKTASLKYGKESSGAAIVSAISSNPSQKSDSDVSETNGPQSLDLSLKLLLQNFCMSPPNESSEIQLSIDIEASNSNPELKLNISQKENQQNGILNQQTLENRATKIKTSLSSQSDSKIPRLKIFHRPSRPSSFSGAVTESGRRTRNLNERSKTQSSKIPIIQTSDSVKEEFEVQSDSIFFSPNSTSEPWVDGASKYFSPPPSPSDEVFIKRESVAKILKEIPGHVQAKVNLYNSKHSASSDSSLSPKNKLFENIKLSRASSEKCPRNYLNNKSKLCASRSCSSNQIIGLPNKSCSHRSRLPDLSKFAHKELKTQLSSTNPLNVKK